MKKFVSVFLMVILFAACSSAFAGADLSAIEAANVLVAIPDVYPSLAQHALYYDLETGEITDGLDSYIDYDPDVGMLYTYVYLNGNVEVWGRGEGYGYLGETQRTYVLGFVAGSYEENMLWIGAQNLGEFYGEQTIITQETVKDGKLLLTTEDAITEDMSFYGELFVGSTLVVRYTINPENLIIETSEVYIRGEDGVEKLYLTSSTEVEPELVLPFDIAALKSPEATREIHVIMDSGTDAEFDYVLEAPLNVPISIYTPEGYELFDDAAGTVPTVGTEPDENGNYPETQTLYCAPMAD